ncbi:Mov34/MPN/PAD-1 family protein [Haloarcula sp. S1CR25-12]|uniref:Mov34/MPN/PAD-1 family protein n=1 Tax=Haloarcula saliterrae TaxID=2950534 RepID=A0ABU2FEL1_9EURY|nr:Mov34/MPN/PAD-1 family protein [Haloarcula sp. S1CR25-12]MDS0260700.1 Mov34/MPN/PAD-1 family protein [Haloarcula sp. S1CR25-12]
MFPRRDRGLFVPEPIRDRLEASVADAHPVEAGGFLACERDGDWLRAVDHVALANEATDPTRRFRATVDERAPGRPRVFYHSHTSAASPSGLTDTDRRHIPERFALVVFAPHGDAYSYRLFRRGLVRWRELAVAPARTVSQATLPRLP